MVTNLSGEDYATNWYFSCLVLQCSTEFRLLILYLTNVKYWTNSHLFGEKVNVELGHTGPSKK